LLTVLSPRYVRNLEEQVRRLSALGDGQDGAHVSPSVAPQREEQMSAAPGPSLLHAHIHRQTSSVTDVGSPESERSRQAAGQEVSGINRHTRNVEFYGSSSSVALLSHVQRAGDEPVVSAEDADAGALVSNLHNTAFSPAENASLGVHRHSHAGTSPGHVTHYSHCRGFLANYFTTIHYVHPILDRAEFFARCEKLWAGEDESLQSSSFAALYYSILSLGAIVGPRDEDPIEGVENLHWSRTFFDEAISRCHRLGMVTDLDMVQCYFILVSR
jgi:hypothetical protein